MANRRDYGTLGKAKRTPSGGIRVPANLSRIGVQTYRNDDGSLRREFRPASEVFSPGSLASFHSAPVTVDHPDGQVTPENWKELSVGHVAENTAPNGDWVTSDICIEDAPTIADIDAGRLVEVSVGYACDPVDTPGGVWQGQPYEVTQTNIRVNHLALLERGRARAGSDARMRLDTTEQVIPVKIQIGDKEYEKGSDEHLARIRSDADALVALEKARADKADKERASEKERADKADKARADATDPKVIHAAAVHRLGLIRAYGSVARKARHVVDAEEEAALGASDTGALLLKIVEMRYPGWSKGKTPEQIATAADLVVSQMGPADDDESEDAVGDEPGEGGAAEGEGAYNGPPRPPPGRTDSAGAGLSIYAARAGAGGRVGPRVAHVDARDRQAKEDQTLCAEGNNPYALGVRK
jgi:hypothetical protein